MCARAARCWTLRAAPGDLALAFAKKVGKYRPVVHTDINEAMLRTGRDRLLDAGVALPTLVCDAEKLPFPTAL
jgi:demethylmenaquinone methyltransferase/2-methoxy-6-polyprenyl-1,4-benzoquinol methylase